PLTDFRGKTSIFSHPVYLFLRKFSLQDSRGGSHMVTLWGNYEGISQYLVSLLWADGFYLRNRAIDSG
ncbi:hypothetical protein NEN86_00980, partial [Escherichia coli]|nr:hypothetical protein [Escherichia coli]